MVTLKALKVTKVILAQQVRKVLKVKTEYMRLPLQRLKLMAMVILSLPSQTVAK